MSEGPLGPPSGRATARVTVFLGIDVGTGTLKAAIFAEDGTLVTAAEESYDAPTSTARGADFDPAVWWEVCRRVVRRVTASHGRSVTAAAIAGQMHGVVLVDGRGRPVRDAVLWPDQRAASVLDDFVAFDDRHPGVLGNPIVPGMAGPILAWLERHEPDRLRQATLVVQPKDWLRMQLCGAYPVTDPSDASATLLYDVAADAWSWAVCDAVGIDRQLLPEVAPSSRVVGAVDPAVAQDLNLSDDVSVVVGSGDAGAALLGAGIEVPGTALVNTGTGGQIMTPVEAPASGRHLGPGIHQYRSASEATEWYAMAAVANVGLALAWVRDIIAFEWDEMYAAADSVYGTADSDPMFLPFFSGEREPSREIAKGGSWSGLSRSHDREALARSAVRGVAFYLGIRARTLMDLTGVSAAVMSGGAVRHRHWVELLATILDRDVTVADAHLTVRGAARLAARGVGSDLPDPEPGRSVEPYPDPHLETSLRAFEEATKRYFDTSA